MTNKRLPTWQHELDALVLERRLLPFTWGANDCVTFAAEAVRRMTGEQLAPVATGAWSSARQAYRALQAYGGLAAAVRSTGLQEVGPRFARRGDVVLLRPPGRVRSMRGALGVCLGERIAAPGVSGLVMARLGEGVTAWRI